MGIFREKKEEYGAPVGFWPTWVLPAPYEFRQKTKAAARKAPIKTAAAKPRKRA